MRPPKDHYGQASVINIAIILPKPFSHSFAQNMANRFPQISPNLIDFLMAIILVVNLKKKPFAYLLLDLYVVTLFALKLEQSQC